MHGENLEPLDESSVDYENIAPFKMGHPVYLNFTWFEFKWKEIPNFIILVRSLFSIDQW